MEEIKKAGGFGCSLDEAEAGNIAPEHGISADNLMPNGVNNSSEVSKELPSDRNKLHSHKSSRAQKKEGESPEDSKRYRLDSRKSRVVEDQTSDWNKHDRTYSRLPEKQRNYGRSSELVGARGEGAESEVYRKYSSRSPDRNYSRSHEQTSHRKDRANQLSEDRARQHTRTRERRSHRSDSVSHHEFAEGHDPYKSRDMY